jgi:hypothetical protein
LNGRDQGVVEEGGEHRADEQTGEAAGIRRLRACASLSLPGANRGPANAEQDRFKTAMGEQESANCQARRHQNGIEAEHYPACLAQADPGWASRFSYGRERHFEQLRLLNVSGFSPSRIKPA